MQWSGNENICDLFSFLIDLASLRGFPICTASAEEFLSEALSDCGSGRGSDGERVGVTLPVFFTLPSATCMVGVCGENTATQPL